MTRPMILGAVFAGGQSRRFGRDKALVEVDGAPLIERVLAALRPQVDAVGIVGRAWPGVDRIEDRPSPGLGPLGALCGSLLHAATRGYDAILTSGCDLPDVPLDVAERLAPAPAVVAAQPLLGLWPVALAEPLLTYLATRDDRSMRGWIRHAGAREVAWDAPLANINTPADLAAYLSSSADRRSSR